MQKELLPTNWQRGFSLIELILSSALILLLATLFTNAVLAGIEGSATGGAYARANLLAEEGLEAVRNIRDDGYSNLSDGTYGIGLSGGAWAFLGTSDTQDGFSRSVQVQTLDATTKQVTSTVTWQLSPTRVGTVIESTYLTNIDTLPAATQADVLLVDISGAVIGGSTSRELQKILLQNTGSVPVTITKMKVSWSPSTNKLTQIFMDGTMVWSTSGPGSPSAQQSSGATTTIQSTTISAGGTIPLNKMLYTGSMRNNSFTIIFTMTDNSQKTVTIPTLP